MEARSRLGHLDSIPSNPVQLLFLFLSYPVQILSLFPLFPFPPAYTGPPRAAQIRAQDHLPDCVSTIGSGHNARGT